MELTFWGTNTLLITKGTSNILIDPHFSRPGLLKMCWKIEPDSKKIESGLQTLGVNNLDGVLLTHTHYDHALDAAAVVFQTGSVLFGSESAANLARGAGLRRERYQVITGNKQASIGQFDVKWIESSHIKLPLPLRLLMPEKGIIPRPVTSPMYFWKYQCGKVYAVLVDNLLIFGSAGILPEMEHQVNAEVVLLSIGGLETKSVCYLERLYCQNVIKVGADLVLLSHWDNFFRPLSKKTHTFGLAKITINRLDQLTKQTGKRMKVLYPGGRINI